MAVSGTLSTTVFRTNRVVDHAFRRCRLKAVQITAEMQGYARDALYLWLSNLGNGKTPSWCIERIALPMYQNTPDVELPVGTVGVLNANYRSVQDAGGTATELPASYTVDFTDATTVNTVGVKWTGASVTLTFQTSTDGATWMTVGTQTTAAVSGEWTWTDITGALSKQYFRVTATGTINYSEVFLGTLPQEVPLGVLNRDSYVAQSNKAHPGRPSTYWYQREREQPILHLWPAPNEDAEHAQLIVWRHRHVMDVGTQAQDVEVPQRWMEAVVAGLAAMVAAETPEVDAQLIPGLKADAAAALAQARDGDNDGSPMFIQPRIAAYTR